MAVEGRTHRPVIDYEKCDTCSVCRYTCPAAVMPELRREEDSLRGKIYRHMGAEIMLKEGPGLLIPPPCQQSCPIGQDVRGYMRLIAEKRYAEALELIRKTNPLPSVCGHLCHYPCEAACTRAGVDDVLSIKSLKRFVADNAPGTLAPPELKNTNGKKVVIVGSGPAGLTAAHELAGNGYCVEIIESHPEPGGMLFWAIPDFRLPADILRRDIDYIRNMGVDIKTGVRFGKDITLSQLESEGFRAVIIATGTTLSLKMNIENEQDIEGCIDCLTFLNRYADKGQYSIGNEVLVIGGGNAAIDSARTALRMGSKNVTILYRRDLDQMPADKTEVMDALDEGVKIEFLTAPAKIITTDGRLSGLQCVKTELADVLGSGRPKPVNIKGSEFVVNADTVISAVGQLPDHSWMAAGSAGSQSLDVTSQKTLSVDDNTMLTSKKMVFATGDVVNGPTTVVEAMVSGKKTARAVDKILSRER